MQIANVRTPDWSRVASTFEWKISERPEPEVFIGGSGVNHVSADDIDLMVKQANIEPREWNNHLGLLAAVNRRTAEREHSREVSPWCQVSYATHENETVTTRLAGERGQIEEGMPIPIVLNSADMTERAVPGLHRRPEFLDDAARAAAFERSVTPASDTWRERPPREQHRRGRSLLRCAWRGAQGSLGGAEQPERVGHEDRSRAAPRRTRTRSHRRGQYDHAERRGQTMSAYADSPA